MAKPTLRSATEHSFGARVRAAREAARLTQSALADAVGITQPTIQAIESGQTRGTKHLVSIARVLGVSPQWLDQATNISKSGPDFEKPQEPRKDSNLVVAGRQFITLDVFDLQHGWPVSQPCDQILLARRLFKDTQNISELCALRMESDAMAPTIGAGDDFVLDCSRKEVTGPGLYAFAVGQALVVGRVHISAADGALTVTHDNPQYGPGQTIAHGSLSTKGKVCLVIRSC